jgi:predicted DNA-binding protein (MmcQ/YjbR family)
MAAEGRLDPRLERVGEIGLGLPEATLERSGRHAVLRVRTRTFAYGQDDHHGDGIVSLVVKAPDGGAALIEADGARYHRPAYLGHRGWLGLRLDRGPVDWEEVEGLLVASYVLVAPKRLAALVTG